MRKHNGTIAAGTLVLLCAGAVLADPPNKDPAERVISDHAEVLSDRRRVNIFFPNEQSASYGVPIRYVNSYCEHSIATETN